MPPKQDKLANPGLKTVQLFLFLSHKRRAYTLTRLSEIFKCSKQTILRYIETLDGIRDIEIERIPDGREVKYGIKNSGTPFHVQCDAEALRQLALCHDIVKHLLPPAIDEKVDDALSQTSVRLHLGEAFESMAMPRTKGRIDYSKSQKTMDVLTRCMLNRWLCSISYRSPRRREPKSYLIAPLKLVCYHDTFYMLARECDEVGYPRRKEILHFAIHRIREAITTRIRSRLDSYEVQVEEHFGFVYDAPFKARIWFSAEAAAYVNERVWSDDQTVTWMVDGSVLLEMTSTSKRELRAWVMSFGPDAELREPAELREETRSMMTSALERYCSGLSSPEGCGE